MYEQISLFIVSMEQRVPAVSNLVSLTQAALQQFALDRKLRHPSRSADRSHHISQLCRFRDLRYMGPDFIPVQRDPKCSVIRTLGGASVQLKPLFPETVIQLRDFHASGTYLGTVQQLLLPSRINSISQ